MMSIMFLCSLMMATSKEKFMLMKSMILDNCTVNILLMSFLSLIILALMNFNNISKNQNLENLIMNISMILAMLAFSMFCPFKFLVMMELIVLPLSWVILNMSKEKNKVEAVKFMVMINTFGSLPFLIYSSNNFKMFPSDYQMMSCMSILMMFFSLILFLSKMPVFMSHFWLTKAHVSASGCCSMILASIMIKLGTMGLFKFYTCNLPVKINEMFLSYTLWSSLVISMLMMRFFDIKILIAISSILHMSMIFPMISIKKSLSMISSVMMMTAHGIVSYLLFYLVTVKYEKSENRTMNYSKSEESSSKNISMMIFIFMFLNIGIPPLMNFLSETMMLTLLKIFKTNMAVVMFSMILILSILFTMQMNILMTYKKKLNLEKKIYKSKLNIYFFFFLSWVTLILFFL